MANLASYVLQVSSVRPHHVQFVLHVSGACQCPKLVQHGNVRQTHVSVLLSLFVVWGFY